MTYDDIVEEYWSKSNTLEPAEVEARNTFLSLLPKEGLILDLACGPGRDAKFFSERRFKVLGVDISEPMLEKAREVAPKAAFEQGDMLHLSLKDTFDGVFFNAGLLAVPKKDARSVLKNVHSVLNPGGILFVSVSEGEGEEEIVDPRYNVKKFYANYSAEELSTLVTDVQFELVDVSQHVLENNFRNKNWIFVLAKKPIASESTGDLMLK